MELVCEKCGYKKQIGTTVSAGDIFVCTECGSKSVKLVDTGGVVIRVDGINENTVVNIVKELAKSVSVYDIFGFLAKQGESKEKDKDKE